MDKIPKATTTAKPKTNPTIFGIVSFEPFTSPVTLGTDPIIKPANKQTIASMQCSNANLIGKYKPATAITAPMPNGNKIKRFLRKYFENSLSTALTIFLNAPVTKAIVPPEIPGTITAQPIPAPTKPSLRTVLTFSFI